VENKRERKGERKMKKVLLLTFILAVFATSTFAAEFAPTLLKLSAASEIS